MNSVHAVMIFSHCCCSTSVKLGTPITGGAPALTSAGFMDSNSMPNRDSAAFALQRNILITPSGASSQLLHIRTACHLSRHTRNDSDLGEGIPETAEPQGPPSTGSHAECVLRSRLQFRSI